MSRRLDLSERYRATQREHDEALRRPQTFPLTGDGRLAKNHTVGKPDIPFSERGLVNPPKIRPSGRTEEQAAKEIARARYLDWKDAPADPA